MSTRCDILIYLCVCAFVSNPLCVFDWSQYNTVMNRYDQRHIRLRSRCYRTSHFFSMLIILSRQEVSACVCVRVRMVGREEAVQMGNSN